MSRPWLPIVALCAIVTPVAAQTPTFSVRREAVRVDVLVTDRGQPVHGLTARDFEILDSGVPQQVELMLDLGFDPLAPGVDKWEAIRWAAFHGNAEMVRLLLPHHPPIGVPDPTYEGTPLGQALYGSLHGWERDTGDFATTVRLLLAAGERPDPADLPIGRDDVDVVLRAHLARTQRASDSKPQVGQGRHLGPR